MGQVRKTIGQILGEAGIINQQQYEQAANVVRQTNQPWDNVLVDLGYAQPKQVAQAKAHQMGVQFVDLSKTAPAPDALALVPAHTAQRCNSVPVKRQDTVLYVAMKNPLDVNAIDDLAGVSGLKIQPVLATSDDIDDALTRLYRQEQDDISSAVGNFKSMNASFVADLEEELAAASGGEDDGKDSAPIIRIATTMLQQAIRDGASDVHVEPTRKDTRVRYRIDGVLHEIMRLPKYISQPLVARLKIMAELNIAERRLPQDGRIPIRTKEGKDYDLRVSTLPNVNGEKVVMRVLDKGSIMIGLNKLGFLPDTQAKLESLVVQPNGMFLCTGPTGSGKTTTQYSVLNKINSVEVNIITIEDPVEYELAGVTQVHVNRKAGLTFASALRAFLRQDPDIIMVGEIRDLETAEIGIQASLTGHLVLSTLHTNDAPSAFTRLTDMGVEPFLSAASIIGILAQRLARKICPNCRVQYQPPADSLKRLGFKMEEGAPPPVLYRGRGCEACRQTGYKGRSGIHELMMINEEIGELASRRAPLGDLKEAARANGMRTLQEDALMKVLAGQTTLDEALRVVFTAGH
ncbi:MAG: Flp pilus assembly complex ATPase component TadA [Armatimonadota bacterium]|nr:Flp pilus assembly complex ATPase component TadA [Armatimonadota bacterium]